MVKPPWDLLRTPGRYVPSHQTDIAATFKRIRAEQAKKPAENVRTLSRKVAK